VKVPQRHQRDDQEQKDPEQELYTCLADYAAVHDTGLLLEQERVPCPTAYPVLTRAMEKDSPGRRTC
jgi:hypothetical protein